MPLTVSENFQDETLPSRRLTSCEEGSDVAHQRWDPPPKPLAIKRFRMDNLFSLLRKRRDLHRQDDETFFDLWQRAFPNLTDHDLREITRRVLRRNIEEMRQNKNLLGHQMADWTESILDELIEGLFQN